MGAEDMQASLFVCARDYTNSPDVGPAAVLRGRLKLSRGSDSSVEPSTI